MECVSQHYFFNFLCIFEIFEDLVEKIIGKLLRNISRFVPLDNTVGTVFKGESLRGMLLNAYAFWQLGQIAMISSWVSFLGGLIFLILALLGFAHSRRTSEDDAI